MSSLASLIQAVEQASTPAALVGAVRQLAAIADAAALPTLIAALGYNNPGAAMAAVDGLVQLGEQAVPALLEQLDGYNYGARAYGIRALAAIADPRALDILLQKAAFDFAPSVRRAAIKGLGRVRWQGLSADQQAIACDRIRAALFQISQDGDWSIRYAAVAALQFFAAGLLPDQARLILQHLQQMNQQDRDWGVRSRIALALTELQTS